MLETGALLWEALDESRIQASRLQGAGMTIGGGDKYQNLNINSVQAANVWRSDIVNDGNGNPV